jgi:hypothetical protein
MITPGDLEPGFPQLMLVHMTSLSLTRKTINVVILSNAMLPKALVGSNTHPLLLLLFLQAQAGKVKSVTASFLSILVKTMKMPTRNTKGSWETQHLEITSPGESLTTEKPERRSRVKPPLARSARPCQTGPRYWK